MADVKTFLPLNNNLQNAERQILPQLQTCLAQQMKNLKTQREDLENQIKQHENTLRTLYSQLERNRYVLHGVCVHEGSADSGHYYSYIKDHKANVWRRFNDHKVEIVAEEDVMSDANGGSVRSAYWLAYVSQEKIS